MSLLAEGDGKFKARLAGNTHTNEKIKTPVNNMFLMGAAADLLAPSYAGLNFTLNYCNKLSGHRPNV